VVSFARASLVLLVASGVLMSLVGNASEPPAGMVVEVIGAIAPPIVEMAEIPADTSVRLDLRERARVRSRLIAYFLICRSASSISKRISEQWRRM
jgi:hypothetical protein